MRTKRSGPPMLRARRSRLRATLTEEQLKLYRLIWQRFVASQMTPAVFDVTTAKIAAVSAKTGKTYDFRLSGSVVRFDGFLKVYEVAEDKKDDDDEASNKLPNLDNVKRLELEKLEQRAALYPAASALQRSFAGEGAGRAGHRAAFDLCVDHQHHSGPRICDQDQRALLSHRDRNGGLRLTGEEFSVYLRHSLHGQAGRGAGRDRRGQREVDRPAERLLRPTLWRS